MRHRRTRSVILAAGVIGCAIASVSMAQDAPDEHAEERPETPPPQPEPACPRTGFTAQLMTPAAGYLPRDSAMVAGLFPGGSDTSGALPSGLELTRGRRSVSVRSEPIAPGLFRLVPETSRIWGRYHLSGVATSPQLYFRRAPLPATPATPVLERVERYRVASAAGPHLEVRAHFSFPIPESVVAVLSYWGDHATPDAFVRGAPTQSSLVLYAGSGRCDDHPPGTNAPPETGGTVRVAFVDRHGQVSPVSAPQPIR